MDFSSLLPGRNVTQMQEYFLQASILHNFRDPLLHRLNGLCDMVSSSAEQFKDHEMVFILSANPGAPVQSVQLNLRRAIDGVATANNPLHLRYYGLPEMGDKSRPTMVRSCIECDVSANTPNFLKDIGFRLDYEYVIKGFLFRKGRMKITVSQINKVLEPGRLERLEPFTQSWLVELSLTAPIGSDQVQEEMKNFSDQLVPLVHLEKIDYKRLQQNL